MEGLFLSFLWPIIANAVITKVSDEVEYKCLWKYNDESNWPGHRCKYGGRRQSPIDIKTKNLVHDATGQFIKNGPLLFKGYRGVLVSGINNGHTIQFTTEGDESIHPIVRGGPLRHAYRLEQMHFHWQSEHAVDGQKYPMEIHFVHVRADLSVYDALAKRDGLAIVAVLCKVPNALDEPSDTFNELMMYIPNLMRTGDRISGAFLDMKKLLSANRTSYYTYLGSLTSPECNEAVIWIVFPQPLFINEEQYKVFSEINPARNNFRQLQNVSQHVVYTPAVTILRVPRFIIFFQDVIGTVKSFFRNMTYFVKTIRPQ